MHSTYTKKCAPEGSKTDALQHDEHGVWFRIITNARLEPTTNFSMYHTTTSQKNDIVAGRSVKTRIFRNLRRLFGGAIVSRSTSEKAFEWSPIQPLWQVVPIPFLNAVEVVFCCLNVIGNDLLITSDDVLQVLHSAHASSAQTTKYEICSTQHHGSAFLGGSWIVFIELRVEQECYGALT